jgi:tRNA pseudouridine55 synthase
LLVIDKPEGPTSHDVVARLRRVLGERRIGHTGTLDPLATGVLALLLGRATRLARFLSSDEKAYRATVRLGQATTTYDREGEPAGPAVRVDHVDPARLETALDAFRGTFLQTPPLYSAKKIGGESAHRLARRGQSAELAAAPVAVQALTVVGIEGPDVTLDLRCSAGFYVRSLAHDLGAALGCGAHLLALRRTAAGPLGLDGALPLAAAEADAGLARSHVRPLSALLPDWPFVRVSSEGAARVRAGALLRASDCKVWTEAAGPGDGSDLPTVRILDDEGGLLALGAWTAPASLHPRVVLV